MRYKFPTRSYKTSGLNELWQMDLLEMIPFARINKGYKYILTCIDVFSRYARALPLKSKKGEDVAQAVNKMFKEVKPRAVQTDLGKEFYNSQVKKVFKANSVKLYSVYSQFKAALVERFNRTLREKLTKLATHLGNKVWYKSLNALIESYNASPHSAIFKWKPVDVTPKTESLLWELKNESRDTKKTSATIKLHDYVRISRTKGTFQKRNFDQNWSDEVFRVVGIDTSQMPIMYILEDHGGQVIQGKFYKQEL